MAKSSIPLTHERLKQVLDYNPETGAFTWKFRSEVPLKWNNRFAGKSAGNKESRGYVSIVINYHRYWAHRLAWLYECGVWPNGAIDHINIDKSDNRIANLREASKAQNAANTGLRPDNTSGFKGVIWHTQRQKWYARIFVNGKHVSLGLHHRAEDAGEAYAKAAKKYFGDFSRSQ